MMFFWKNIVVPGFGALALAAWYIPTFGRDAIIIGRKFNSSLAFWVGTVVLYILIIVIRAAYRAQTTKIKNESNSRIYKGSLL